MSIESTRVPPASGQAAMTGSSPVVVASDQSPVPTASPDLQNLLLLVLIELRVQSTILQATLGSLDDIDALRSAEAAVIQSI